MTEKVRQPAVAGMFYDNRPDELHDYITYLLSKVEADNIYGNIAGLIAPHAGYRYSGLTAAYAYKQIENKSYKRVIVVSPSHREYFEGISIYDGNAYATPLGQIKIDRDTAERLVSASADIFFGESGHRSEHALEVHLPFLQSTLSEFKLIPMVMGQQNEEAVNKLAANLATLIDPDTLLVASTDLSHFFDKKTADMYDSRVAERITAYDYEGLLDDIAAEKSHACGAGPMAAVMKACSEKGYDQATVLHRSDSGDSSGDNSEVVGYLSAVLYR